MSQHTVQAPRAQQEDPPPSPQSPPQQPSIPPPLTTTQVIGLSSTLLRDCPSSNNTLYTINTGTPMSFRKICGTTFINSLGTANVVAVTTTSLDDCINLCGAYNELNQTAIAKGTNNVCNAVCWRNGFVGDDFPAMCFGFTTRNTNAGFATQSEAICDAAASWINESF